MLENFAGTVTLIPEEGALCSVNGSVVTGPCQLTQGKTFRDDALAQDNQKKCRFLTHHCEAELLPSYETSPSPHSNALEA